MHLIEVTGHNEDRHPLIVENPRMDEHLKYLNLLQQKNEAVMQPYLKGLKQIHEAAHPKIILNYIKGVFESYTPRPCAPMVTFREEELFARLKDVEAYEEGRGSNSGSLSRCEQQGANEGEGQERPPCAQSNIGGAKKKPLRMGMESFLESFLEAASHKGSSPIYPSIDEFAKQLKECVTLISNGGGTRLEKVVDRYISKVHLDKNGKLVSITTHEKVTNVGKKKELKEKSNTYPRQHCQTTYNLIKKELNK